MPGPALERTRECTAILEAQTARNLFVRHATVDDQFTRAFKGSGATAVQVIQTIAPDVAHLSVFQRTPNWCTPLRNALIDDEAQKDLKQRAEEIFAHCKQTFAGFIHDADSRAGGEVSKAERFAQYEALFARGGFALWLANYRDLFTNREIADEVGQFLAEKVGRGS